MSTKKRVFFIDTKDQEIISQKNYFILITLQSASIKTLINWKLGNAHLFVNLMIQKLTIFKS